MFPGAIPSLDNEVYPLPYENFISPAAARTEFRVILHDSGTLRDSENAINDFCPPKSGKPPTMRRLKKVETPESRRKNMTLTHLRQTRKITAIPSRGSILALRLSAKNIHPS